MSIDLNALRKMIEAGEPSSKVMVSRRWLAEVHKMLAEKPKPHPSGLAGDKAAQFDSIMGDVFGKGWRR